MAESMPLRRPRHHLVAVVLLFILTLTAGTTGRAYDGFTVALAGGIPVGGAMVLNARAIAPLLTIEPAEPVDLAVRADVSYAIGGSELPSVGVTGLLAGPKAADLPVASYLGAGLSTSLSNLSSVSWQVVTGWRVPVVDPLQLVFELQLAGLGLDLVAPTASLGVEFTFGGGQQSRR